jgi:hypothetical protein
MLLDDEAQFLACLPSFGWLAGDLEVTLRLVEGKLVVGHD